MSAGDDLRKYLIAPFLVSPSILIPPAYLASNTLFDSSVRPETPPANLSTNPLFDSSPRPETPRFHKSAQRKADDTDSNMELDKFPQPPTRSGSPARTGDVVNLPIDNVFTLNDFIANMQADGDSSREASQQPPAKKPKMNADFNSNASATLPQPVAVSARSSKYTILLHEKYQALGIPQPVFSFGGDTVFGWSVELSFPGLEGAEELQGLTEEGMFASKQEAKEAVSKRALGELEDLERAGRIVRPEKSKPEKSKSQQLPVSEEEGVNYVGQLLGTYLPLISSPCLVMLRYTEIHAP